MVMIDVFALSRSYAKSITNNLANDYGQDSCVMAKVTTGCLYAWLGEGCFCFGGRLAAHTLGRGWAVAGTRSAHGCSMGGRCFRGLLALA